MNGFINERLKAFWGLQMVEAIETCWGGRGSEGADSSERIPFQVVLLKTEILNGSAEKSGHGVCGVDDRLALLVRKRF